MLIDTNDEYRAYQLYFSVNSHYAVVRTFNHGTSPRVDNNDDTFVRVDPAADLIEPFVDITSLVGVHDVLGDLFDVSCPVIAEPLTDTTSLVSVLVVLGDKIVLNSQTIYQMITDLDKNKSGNIGFEEFLDMMTARMSDKGIR